jgi:hypothetical protein
MSGTRRSRKQTTVKSKLRKSTTTPRTKSGVLSKLKKYVATSSYNPISYSYTPAELVRVKKQRAGGAKQVPDIKADIKSKKLMAEAKLAAKKKIAAEKKRQEFAKKKKDLMKAAKKKGLKLRTDYTALYRKPKT